MSSKLEDNIAILYDEDIHEKMLTPETCIDMTAADATKIEEKEVGIIPNVTKNLLAKDS